MAQPRITVNLKPRAVQALEEAVGVTEENQTEVVNRALVLYARIVGLIETDNAAILVRVPGHEDEQLWLL